MAFIQEMVVDLGADGLPVTVTPVLPRRILARKMEMIQDILVDLGADVVMLDADWLMLERDFLHSIPKVRVWLFALTGSRWID
jgi:hypothetical protein